MNQRPTSFAASLAVCLLVSACSSSSPPGPGAGGVDAGLSPSTTVTFSMHEQVPGGTEQFRCQLVTMPAGTAGYVIAGQHTFTPGSHHMLLYKTDFTSVPADQQGVFDCADETGIMGHIRGVVYGAQTPQGNMQYPDGVGLPYQAGEILLLQTHYLNAGVSALDAGVNLTLTVRPDGVTNPAGVFFFYDPFIDVPAGARGKATMRCAVPHDVTLLGAGSHYHKRGVGYAAYVDAPSGAPAATPFYTSSDWSNPRTLATNLPIAAGSHIRFECDYDNTQGTQDYYAGPSAANNEMCMFIGVYYPDLGVGSDFCLSSADEFGTGTSDCKTATTCLQACPSGGNEQYPNFAPCIQKCIASTCPSASGPLLDQLQCIQGSCNDQCILGKGDCTSCAVQNCAQQVSACQAHACN
ncbi:MAG TPA: hypothetical protein VE987_07765 [Polyangiaceae bacterium]|nr:hypothetical protein [Polyangiaceae bacterium]